jgi:hypothetical protein
MLCCGRRLFYNLEHVWRDQVQPPEYPHTRAISVQQLSMLYELLQLDFGELHKPVDLVLGAVEVLETEGVDCDDLNAALVADL